MLSLKEI